MPKNRFARALGRLRGKTFTSVDQSNAAKKRWIDLTPDERKKFGEASSERMRNYWIGWREAKERDEKRKRNSIRHGFK